MSDSPELAAIRARDAHYGESLPIGIDNSVKDRRTLLRAASKQAPPGCHCTARCAAPVIMGRQTPCRDPEKAARFQSEPDSAHGT